MSPICKKQTAGDHAKLHMLSNSPQTHLRTGQLTGQAGSPNLPRRIDGRCSFSICSPIQCRPPSRRQLLQIRRQHVVLSRRLLNPNPLALIGMVPASLGFRPFEWQQHIAPRDARDVDTMVSSIKWDRISKTFVGHSPGQVRRVRLAPSRPDIEGVCGLLLNMDSFA